MSDPTPDVSKPASNTHRAAEELRALILSGDLAAGSNHLETELAARLNMSRTPVREATRLLEAQGLLEVQPRKGVRISALSPDDMREIYEILTALESVAAANAAKAGYDDAALAGLAQSIDDMDDALTRDDLRAWAIADDTFHTELSRLGGNSRIERVVSMMSDQVHRARAMTLFMRDRPLQSNHDHRAVLDAIRNGSPSTAHAVHHAHRVQAKETLLALLEKHRLPQV